MATSAVEVAAKTSTQAGVQLDMHRQKIEKGMVGANTCSRQAKNQPEVPSTLYTYMCLAGGLSETSVEVEALQAKLLSKASRSLVFGCETYFANNGEYCRLSPGRTMLEDVDLHALAILCHATD